MLTRLRHWAELLLRGLFLLLISSYQMTLAFFFGGRCRFHPSCSHYAKEAFMNHSPGAALRLTLKRLIKCHPWGPFGEDPVPPKVLNKRLGKSESFSINLRKH